MPQLSDQMTEATIGRWLKAAGETVARDEPLLELLSDKVTTEVVAPADGVLGALLAQEGQSVAVGALLVEIFLAGEEPPAGEAYPASVASATSMPVSSSSPSASPVPSRLAATETSTASAVAAPVITVPPSPGEGSARRLQTPRVRQIAAEHGVTDDELVGLTGSGLGGLVTSADLLAYLARRPASPALPSAPARVTAPATVSSRVLAEETVVPLTPMRRAIAEHMTRSVATATHAWLAVEIDMEAVTRARTAARAPFEAAEGFSLTYLTFFALATVGALRALPALNATWEGETLTPRRELHLGVAVATEGGLLVPVVPDADGLNLVGMARALNDRIARARAGRLTPADMSNGTFTINNTGAVGSILSRPIINQPQVAILTMEAIVRRPRVTADDAIVIRPMMNACLSYDSRALDDAVAGAFLAELKRRLERWAPAE